MPDEELTFEEVTKEELFQILLDHQGDMYSLFAMIGDIGGVPAEWVPKANELLQKYRPMIDRIEANIAAARAAAEEGVNVVRHRPARRGTGAGLRGPGDGSDDGPRDAA